jgi:hypothetical protein
MWMRCATLDWCMGHLHHLLRMRLAALDAARR